VYYLISKNILMLDKPNPQLATVEIMGVGSRDESSNVRA
jgi:hypothetical protein